MSRVRLTAPYRHSIYVICHPLTIPPRAWTPLDVNRSMFLSQSKKNTRATNNRQKGKRQQFTFFLFFILNAVRLLFAGSVRRYYGRKRVASVEESRATEGGNHPITHLMVLALPSRP